MPYKFLVLCSSINGSSSGCLKIYQDIFVLQLEKLDFSDQHIEVSHSHKKIRAPKINSDIWSEHHFFFSPVLLLLSLEKERSQL